MTRDGWVKRQKEVKDLATTRLREGDSVLAVVRRQHARDVRLLHAISAAPTRARLVDLPASTGYGEPIQSLFKFKDGEQVVGALSLDPRVVGNINVGRRPDDAAAGPRGGRDERRLQPAVLARGRSSSRARAPAGGTPASAKAPRSSASRK